MAPSFATLVIAPLAIYALYRIVKTLYAELSSPLRTIPGPLSAHWFYGNTRELVEDQFSGLLERWVQEYGPTIRIHEVLGTCRLVTTDLKAIHHLLNNTTIYQKSVTTRETLSLIVGPGLLVVENEDHRQQRKIMNPAFGVPQIRALNDIFIHKSTELRDILIKQASQHGGSAPVEILSWLSKVSLDIIGLAGFNYNIHALESDENSVPDELIEAFDRLCDLQAGISITRFIQHQFPILRYLPSRTSRVAKEAQAQMMRVGRRILAESKREVLEGGDYETGRGRDLLSLLVRANTSKDVPIGHRLSDEDALAQVPTFLVAGHETTSTAVTWALFALTQNIAAQTRLREELLTTSTDHPTMDELDDLPYLDCVVRETLRLHAPVSDFNRIALCDDIIPLDTPFTDSHGILHQTLEIKKGQLIFVPIISVNKDPKIWGEDAAEFRPQRWEGDKPVANGIPGIYSHMLTFLGGPRNCIGFRFAIAEIKALLFVLVRAFEFQLAVPRAEIGQKDTGIVVRPVLLSRPEAGSQLPLLVKPVAI
ncbi:cytochrome P450 [Mycena amicta]|nr:cytochrome P450 [Mycena amicta]